MYYCLDIQDIYDLEFVTRVRKLPSATLSEVLDGSSSHSEVKLQYSNKKDFESIAKRLKIMSDLRVCDFTQTNRHENDLF